MLGLALLSVQARASDAQSGRLLYETHCGGCHYERLHDRVKTKINSLAALRAEVAKWAAQTGRKFSAAELEDIVEYLNQSHYRTAQ